MKKNEVRVVKRLTKAEKYKIRQANKIKELLRLKGKSEKWLIDELKRVFKINKSITKTIINGELLIDLQHYLVQVSFLLGVRYQVFLEV